MGKGGGRTGAGRSAMQAGLGYWTPSVKPRNLMFKQLASALATGGKGMRMPFAQQAQMRSAEAGQAAVRGADSTLANLDPAARSMIINRIMQTNKAATNSIAPSIASRLIQAAPGIVTGGAAPINAGFANVATGMDQAVQRQAIVNRGYSELANGIGSAAGYGAGTAGGEGGWYARYFSKKPAGGAA